MEITDLTHRDLRAENGCHLRLTLTALGVSLVAIRSSGRSLWTFIGPDGKPTVGTGAGTREWTPTDAGCHLRELAHEISLDLSAATAKG